MAGFTRSGIPLKDFYTATDIPAEPPLPGAAPFTRAIDASGYVGRPWVMGQYGGFGSAGMSVAV
jgi:methylmalonyl-CoA mutase N-terminal domain/subunit